jgi:UDP-N-acetylmuramate--alanine ligase
MELSGFKKIYIVGIEGAGTSGLAQIYHNLGFEVSGSDNGDHFYWDVLRGKGIKVFQKFDAANVPDDIDFAVHSSAFKEDNPEIAEIKRRGIPLYTYSQAMGEFFNQHVGISVCGSHGKTTTSAILATALKAAGVDTSAFVGSRVLEWDSNVLLGGGEYFVFESDEYQNKLQYYEPWAAILTSVDWDHPDFFPDFEVYKKAFKDFVAKLSKTGFLVVWGDSIATLEVAKSATSDVLTYGFGEDNLYRIVLKERLDGDKQEFEVFFNEKSLGIFETPLTGKHNVLNSCSVIAMCHRMQLDLDKVKEALANFKGTARRFEKVGTRNGALLIDDYAHHPDEVKATLAGAREKFGDKNITVIFHPHSFTRTKALLHEFAQSFDDADKVVVIDIYGSAREAEGDVSSEDLVKLINKYAFDKAEYIPTINEAIEFFENKLKENDVLITMGAGDVWKVADKLKEIK